MARITEGAVWFAVLVVAYLVFIGTVSPLEVGVGATVAVVGAVVAVLAKRAERLAYHPGTGWLGWLLPLPAAILADTVRVMVLLACRLAGRPVHGRIVEFRLPDAPPGRARGRRAVAMLLLSMPPGSYVLGYGADEHTLRLHRLTAARRMERAVSR